MSMLEGLPTPDTTTSATAQATIPTAVNGYIPLPVTIDPQQLIADAFGFIQLQIPGWVPYEGQIEAWLIEACAQMVATYAQVAAMVPLAIFSYLGGALLNVPPNVGTPATAPTTWTMVDSAGYTVPAGTVVAFQVNGNSYTLFETVDDFTVTTGTTEATGVTVQATAVGSYANAIAAGPMVLADSLAYVSSVVSTQVTAGGSDPETTQAYLSRLASQLQLLSPRPILPADFAALSVGQSGAARAIAIDLYNVTANMLTGGTDDLTGTTAGTWGPSTSSPTGNCTVAASTAQVQQGTHSLAVTATASGAFEARTSTSAYPVSPGSTYAAVLSSRAAVTPETMNAVLRWYDGNGTLISSSVGTGAADTTSSWTALTVSATAPSTAATAAVGITGSAATASEVHYVGEAALFYLPQGASVPAWSAGGQMTNQQRTVSVFVVDDNGDPLPPADMAAISAYLQELREVNFVVNVAAPNYYFVNVVTAVVANYGANPDNVVAAVETALTNYLAPANWAGGNLTPPTWLNDPVVRYLSVASVINAVPGVHNITSLTLNGGTSDVTMPGIAPLPNPTLSVTATVAAAGS